MKKLFKKTSLYLIALFLIVAIISFFNEKKGDNNLASIKFKIEKGENVWKVGRNLKEKKVIDSQLSFVFYAYKKGEQKKIKAGEYLINSKLTISEIIELFVNGAINSENNQKKITFPEGWTTKQVATKLSESGFDKDRFLELTKDVDYFKKKYGYSFLENIPTENGLEGFLFPDTYFFTNNSDMEDVIIKMLDNFDQKLSVDLRGEIKKQNKTIYEIVTMASIIEREVKSNEDRKIVSGIFWRRLMNKQAFQSCATLAYILGENKKQYSYEDTQVKSLYNTYLYSGLPPGPISNPGINSILAAIYPIKTNYNYFLSNPETGKTVFSRTLEEHNLNKVKNGL